MQKFVDTFVQNITPKHTILIWVSWWVDSMVLLDLVMKSHPHDKIIVAHIDHSLRWAESDGDREFVAQFCNRNSIICEVLKEDIQSLAREAKMSIEAIARQVRYDFFELVRKKFEASYILTAHHADDQAETIILNLIKWGKIHGLSGMSALSGHILRPLLTVSKAEILEYAEKQGIMYREDSTNHDVVYERNKIRHHIVPVLRSINPTVQETFSELSEYMQELSEFIDTQIVQWLHQSENISRKEHTFFSQEFLQLSPFFQREIIAHLYRTAQWGSSQWLSQWLIDELIRFIGDKNSYGIKEIKNLRIERRGERVYY